MTDSSRLMIGLEIHIELATQSKMFTSAPNPAHPDWMDAAPNTLIDPVVLALPGALPTMNRAAIELSMRVGLALGCTIAAESQWDRKNYFYPDLPKGYQISQLDRPLCSGGSLEINGAGGEPVCIRIIRAHLEEDAGKLAHELPGGAPYAGSLVDLNRAGTPLLEVVTQPDFTCAADVVTFCRELRMICRMLGVTQGIMQRGHIRFEPNINVIIQTNDEGEIATPIVEIKNLNSFRAVESAIEHEYHRQRVAWREDGLLNGPGMKTTRGWDEARGVTFLQRAKEDAHDYRYFPEADLPVVVIDDAWRNRVAAALPELPQQIRTRWQRDAALSEVDIDALLDDPATAGFFDACVAALVATDAAPHDAGHQCAKFLLNPLARFANDRQSTIVGVGLSAPQVAGILALRAAGSIGSSAVDVLIAHLHGNSDDPGDGTGDEPGDDPADVANIAQREGLLQVSDDTALDAWIDTAALNQPQAAADFAAGKDAAMGRLIGEVMKVSRGQADASRVQQRLRARR